MPGSRLLSTIQLVKNGISIQSVEDWFIQAPPMGGERHWKPERSALECARAWCTEDGGVSVPAKISLLLDSHPDTQGAVLQTGIPEHRVPFDTLRGNVRNTDLVVQAENHLGLLAISIDAKVDEPFDRTVQEIVADTIDDNAHGGGSKVNTRIQNLAASLLPPREGRVPRLGDLRYQLLTATAGALAYAVKLKAKCAILIIHEFTTSRMSRDKQRVNTRDLNAFVRRISGGKVTEVKPGKLIGPLDDLPAAPLFDELVPLYIGKVRSSAQRLSARRPARGSRG